MIIFCHGHSRNYTDNCLKHFLSVRVSECPWPISFFLSCPFVDFVAKSLLLLTRALTLVLGQKLLAQTDRLGRDFYQFVVVNELQRLLQGKLDGRHQADHFVFTGGTHVVQLLALGGVNHQVIVAAVDTTKLAFVDFLARVQEQLAPALQGFQGVGQRGTGRHGNDNAVLAAGYVTHFHRAVVAEGGGQDAGTGGHGQEGVPETNQAAGRNGVFQADSALAIRDHVGHVTLTQTHLLHNRALVLLFDVDDHVFVRLFLLAVYFLDHHFRAAYGQLEVFTAHVLDQNRQVQFTTTGYLELVSRVAFFNPQRHVVQQLLFQTLFDVTAGHVLAFFAGKR